MVLSYIVIANTTTTFAYDLANDVRVAAYSRKIGLPGRCHPPRPRASNRTV
jgi:hypothetical protein